MSDLRDTINLEASDAYADARAAWLAAGQPDDDTIPADVRAMGGGLFGPDDWLDDIPWVTPATTAQRAAIDRMLAERRKAADMITPAPTDSSILRDVARSVRNTVLLNDPLFLDQALSDLAWAHVEESRAVNRQNVLWVKNTYQPGEIRNQALEAIAEVASIKANLTAMSRDRLLQYIDGLVAPQPVDLREVA